MEKEGRDNTPAHSEHPQEWLYLNVFVSACTQTCYKVDAGKLSVRGGRPQVFPASPAIAKQLTNSFKLPDAGGDADIDDGVCRGKNENQWDAMATEKMTLEPSCMLARLSLIPGPDKVRSSEP